MNTHSRIDKEKNWGYSLLPKAHPNSPGYSGLDIRIRHEPTGEHFDPRRVRLQIKERDGDLGHCTLSWLLAEPDKGQLVPGPITIQDHQNKTVTFFSFGGTFQLSRSQEEILIKIVSPAPILELSTESGTFSGLMAATIEEVLAHIRAQWNGEESKFGYRLASCMPLQFYAAALETLSCRIRQVQDRHSLFEELYHWLGHEKTWLADTSSWSVDHTTLTTLLAPSQ